jgi:branched-chain amino acid aminotransferase
MSKSVILGKTRLDETGSRLHPVFLSHSGQSLDEITTSLPGGAYTTLRTYQGDRVICLRDQIQRLEQSAQLAGKPVVLDEGRLRAVMRFAIDEARAQLFASQSSTPGGRKSEGSLNLSGGQDELRLRLILDLESQTGDLYIAVEALETPGADAYQNGVRVITCSLERMQPAAKLTRFIVRSRSLRQSIPPGVNEAVMVDAQGYLLEGLTSNFFAILQGKMRTAQQGVLAGITRGLALESARRLSFPVELYPVRVAELASMEEAFITSSSRGVLPVCQIDGVPVGSGAPGTLTLRLMKDFDELVLARSEPI